MGEVFLAEDTKLDRKVALKILPPEFAEDADRMSRFVREAKSASALNHPNIITIYEIGESNGTHFIATEFIDGQTLNDYKQANPLSYKSALEIAIQVASALDEAHRAGIVHRDIKPDNVMIRLSGLAKILDFGIAKLTGRGETETARRGEEDKTLIAASPSHPGTPSTNPGMIIGTANYMSPEQAKGKEVDTRTDIFSFGVLLYEMMAGHLPFDGENALEMIGAILHKEAKPLNSDVPPEIAKIINKCLRKDRDERYQTIKDVFNDLKDVKQDLEFHDKLERSIIPNQDENKTQILKSTTLDEINQTTTNQTVASNSKIKYLTAGLLTLLLAVGGFFGYKSLFTPTNNQINSIAVLPFENRSGNADSEYLSDGLAESLIYRLSQLPNLKVSPTSSVFRYKGKETDAKKVADELGVDSVMTGRITQRGDNLTISVELVDVRNNKSLWGEQYERKMSELLTTQREIASEITNKLQLKLSGNEKVLTKQYTTNPEAYQLYLKGRYYWNRRTAENLKKAIEQFKAATERDPNYALAYSGLADCHVLLPEYAGIPTGEAMPQAKAYAEKAIAIDENLAEGHASLGGLNLKSWKWAESETEFKRAIELNPNYATAYHWYCVLLRNLGRFDEAAQVIGKAQELDPLSVVIANNVVQTYRIRNDFAKMAETSIKLIELDPNYHAGYQLLGESNLKLGRENEAIANFQKSVELSNRGITSLMSLGSGYAVTGKRSEANAIVKELEQRYNRKESSGVYIAAVFAGLGDKDKAFEWLEKDFQSRSGELAVIRFYMQFEPLRDDPRYKDLLKRMGLPE